MDLNIGGFHFTETGVKPVSERVKPTKHGWRSAMLMAQTFAKASQYWPDGLVHWLETESGWDEHVIEQLKADCGVARQTAYNRRSVAKRVPEHNRALAPTFGHASAVASLEPNDQERLLKQARDKGWSVSETARKAKDVLRPTKVRGQANLEGRYHVVYATPHDAQWRDQKALMKLPIAAHTQDRSVLFMMVSNARLFESKDIIEAWGFDYQRHFVWDKVRGPYDHYLYSQHETLILATRGHCLPDHDVLEHDHASIFRERVNEHNSRPTQAFKLIESLYDGPYLQLFADTERAGWSTFGHDPKQWKAAS